MSFKLNIRCAAWLILMISGFGAMADTEGKKVTVDLYGHLISFTYQPERPDAVSIAEITAFYRNSLQTAALIEQMDSMLHPFDADDMVKLLVLKKLVAAVYKNETQKLQTLFMYSVLLEQHKDVLLGYADEKLTLYGRTNVAIDNCLFIQKGIYIYYDLSFSQTAVPETQHEFAAARDDKKYVPLVMNLITPPKFDAMHTEKVLPFEYDGFVYFFKTQINLSLVKYYSELPTISINTVYLNYGLSALAKQSLVKEMQKAVGGMNKTRALDFILKFTQQSIEYRKDVIEKFAFPEETLMANFADCEDKATLFATLVKDVLRMHTVALYYKNAEHINVAVASWNKQLEGNFTFNNEQYIVCEPSGKGYSLGENSINSNMARLIDW
jgi:hypothetical protein